MSAVAISTLGNARRGPDRSGRDRTGHRRTIAANFGPSKFVTGIVGELDIDTGWWRWSTCGHPPALLVRNGRVVKQLDFVNGVPLASVCSANTRRTGQERLPVSRSTASYRRRSPPEIRTPCTLAAAAPETGPPITDPTLSRAPATPSSAATQRPREMIRLTTAWVTDWTSRRAGPASSHSATYRCHHPRRTRASCPKRPAQRCIDDELLVRVFSGTRTRWATAADRSTKRSDGVPRHDGRRVVVAEGFQFA